MFQSTTNTYLHPKEEASVRVFEFQNVNTSVGALFHFDELCVACKKVVSADILMVRKTASREISQIVFLMITLSEKR